jgi:hypothetical protein
MPITDPMSKSGAILTKTDSMPCRTVPATAVSGSEKSHSRYGLPQKNKATKMTTAAAAKRMNDQWSAFLLESFALASCRLMTSSLSESAFAS